MKIAYIKPGNWIMHENEKCPWCYSILMHNTTNKYLLECSNKRCHWCSDNELLAMRYTFRDVWRDIKKSYKSK